MRKLLAILTAAAAFAAAPALAMDVAGFYAGFYVGDSTRNDARIDYSLTSGGFVGPSSFKSPHDIVNGGIDPNLFDALNKALAKFPFASGGSGGGLIANGVMSFDPALISGGVVGYSFGNGVRVELEYSQAKADASTIAFDSSASTGASGLMDPSGVWTWTSLGSFDTGPLPATDVDLVVPVTTLYTKAEFLLVNGWYDFGTGTVITPYVGGGAGVAKVSTLALDDCTCGTKTVFGAETTYTPAAQLGAGIKVRLADPVSLDLGYRYKVAAGSGVGFTYVDDSFFPAFQELGLQQSGLIGIHSVTAGLTFALN